MAENWKMYLKLSMRKKKLCISSFLVVAVSQSSAISAYQIRSSNDQIDATNNNNSIDNYIAHHRSLPELIPGEIVQSEPCEDDSTCEAAIGGGEFSLELVLEQQPTECENKYTDILFLEPEVEMQHVSSEAGDTPGAPRKRTRVGFSKNVTLVNSTTNINDVESGVCEKAVTQNRQRSPRSSLAYNGTSLHEKQRLHDLYNEKFSNSNSGFSEHVGNGYSENIVTPPSPTVTNPPSPTANLWQKHRVNMLGPRKAFSAWTAASYGRRRLSPHNKIGPFECLCRIVAAAALALVFLVVFTQYTAR
tara:strand:- start:3222 stop:4133 length:912 start_codon:yes stop_codon:yes gene_type:complete